MDTTAVFRHLEAAVTMQLQLAGGDESVIKAGEVLLASLEPALRQATFALAEQAAHEVSAQLPGHRVEVALRGGEPELVIAEDRAEPVTPDEDLEARITVRLPTSLKSDLEAAASVYGDSVNAFVIKALRSKASRRKSHRFTGTIDT
ncbi:MAG: DUF1778 domain-containing protein [Acidobacteria bacterium]|nr:DUF1778 domain-containing protein [Acidobacteriota bacterium]MCH8986469.1 DUF1778 domain-containing protein [Acidobacteriota bacterium]